MNQKELITKYVNEKNENKEREIGHYYASEIYNILIGQLTPKNFFDTTAKDSTSSAHIFRGIKTEEAQKDLFDFAKIKYEYQVRKEIKIDDFIIVAKLDFLFPEYILEIKSPLRWEGIKDSHKPQLECYYRAFNLPVKIMYVRNLFEFYKTYNYKPSDQLWDTIQNKMKEFHQLLLIPQSEK